MLYRRRANLSSASCLHRYMATNSLHTPPRHRFPNPVPKTLSFLPAPARRPMQSFPQPTASCPSTTSTCRWKRGRPVSPRYASSNPVTGASAPSLSRFNPQFLNATERASLGSHAPLRHVSTGRRPVSSCDAAMEASISETLQHTQLIDSVPINRFTPATRVRAQHVMSTDNDNVTSPHHVTEPSIPSGGSTQAIMQPTGIEGVHDLSQEASIAHAQDDSFESETTSPEDESMTQLSDSEYTPSLQEEDVANELLKGKKRGKKRRKKQEEEEHVDLDFQIPEETLRAAMLAPPQTRASFWSAKMYRGPKNQLLSTHYCRSMEVAERVAQYFLKEKVVGFDIEWRPFSNPNNIKLNASLIQLACEDRIALFHLSLFPGNTAEELMPPTLKTILESPDILKVGVAVKGDFSRLQRYLNVEAQGVFELSRLHNLVEWYDTDPKKITNKLVGLATQVHKHLQLPLYKGEQLAEDPAGTASVRESDWSKPLDVRQIHYAAADAYAGFRLYDTLEWKRKQLRPIPPTRGLCDYDAKRSPKPKAPKEKVAKTAKAAATCANEDSDEQDQDQLLQREPPEVESSEEEEGYQTAPEELIDSHELEDPTQASSMDSQPRVPIDGITTTKKTPAQNRVGRVKFSRLLGPDPQYPVLPQHPEDCDTPVPSPLLATSEKRDLGKQEAARSSHLDMRQVNKTEDDEFADPELEKDLQVFDLDGDGKLIDTQKPVNISFDKDNGTHSVDAIHTKSLHTANTADPPHDPDFKWPKSTPTNLDMDLPTTTSTTPNPSTQYLSATTWAQTYFKSTIPSPSSTPSSPGIRATISHLRAYHLWHHQHLPVPAVASCLRDPPLRHATVAGYILQAIARERLEYNPDSFREVVACIPPSVRRGPLKWMLERIGGLE